MILNRGKRNKWIAKYTLMFALVMLPLLALVLVSGKGLIWEIDGYYQQYTTMHYASSAIRSLLSGNGFSMVDYTLGQGLDSIGTLGYYGLTDPFQWLAALFTGNGVEVYYHFLIFLYIYLTGLLFGSYANRYLLKKEGNSWIVAISGMLYAFCGYQTIGIIKNPYYASGPIYLAMMLIAVECVLRERKWLMMSITAALMLLANFYLAYQTTLLAVLYIIIRLAFRFKERGLRKSAGDGFVLLGSYILGLGISMVLLLPSAINFIQSGRTGAAAGYTDSLLHYPWAYYLKLALLFCAPYDFAGYWALQSFSPLCLMCIWMMFFSRKKEVSPLIKHSERQLRTGYILLLICLCVPLAGKIFNGMGYVTNRWNYGYAFAVCAVSAWELPRLFSSEYNGRKRLAVVGLAWALLMIVYGVFAHKIEGIGGGSEAVAIADIGIGTKNLAGIAGGFALAAAALCLILLDKKLKVDNAKAMRVVAVMASLCCFAYSIGYGVVAATSSEFYPIPVLEHIERQTVSAAAEIDDDSFYRVDTGISMDGHAPVVGYNGTSYYWSMVPSWVFEHYSELESSGQRWIFRQEGMGSDSYIDALASVKYCVRPLADTQNAMPVGYELKDTVVQPDGDEIGIYENQYALPVGYLFDAAISREEYDQLNPIQKRQALISAALLEEKNNALDAFDISFSFETTEWEIADMQNVEMEGNEIRAKAGGSLTFRIEAQPDCETYLRLKGTEVKKVRSNTDLRIDSVAESQTNRAYIISPEGNFNYDQTGVCLRLGHSESGISEFMLRFAQESVLKVDEIEVISVPAEYFRSAIADIKARGTWEPLVEKNRVSGSITVDNPSVLQISIPFSAGWTAEIDGNEAEILHCGGMYMGLMLDEGEHEIELKYVTPGLKSGACITLASVLIAAAFCIAGGLKRRREKTMQ